MRELDRNNVYLDATGRPLKGRVFFYVKNSTTIQNVYGSDGVTLLANPMYTANGKLAPQVFLQDKDYSIVWESYVGNGDMRTDTRSASWKQAGEAISLQPVLTVEIPSKGLVNAENISALRNIDPSLVDEGVVTLLGFNVAGDKPAINYKWNSSSTASDNGASVIKPTAGGNGAWELVSYGDIDCRHLGVFPADTAAATSNEQSLMIASANAYAVRNNVNIVFSGKNDDVGFFRLLSGNYTRFYCSNANARFVALDDVEVALNQVGKNPFYVSVSDGFKAKFTLIGTALRASFNVNASADVKWNASEYFYIDVVDQTGVPSVFDGTNAVPVFIEQNSKAYQFKNINEIQGKKLSSNQTYSFTSSVFTDRYFENNTFRIGRINLNDCVIDIDNFSSVNNWIDVVKKSGSYNFDFGGKTISENITLSSTAGISVSNGVFTGSVTFESANKSTFVNCRFSNFISSNAVNNIEFVDCVVSGPTIVGSAISAHHTVFNSTLGNAGNVISSVSADSSTFNSNVFAVGIHVDGCVVNATLNSYASNGSVNFSIKNCVFNDVGSNKGYHYMTGTEEYSVNGWWVGNVFNGTKFIEDDGNAVATGSSTVYEGNVGNCAKNDEMFDVSLEDVTVERDGVNISAMSQESYAYYVYDGLKISLSPSTNIFGYGQKSVTFELSGLLSGTYEVEKIPSGSGTMTREVERPVQFTIGKNINCHGMYSNEVSLSFRYFDKDFVDMSMLQMYSARVHRKVF